MKKSQNFKLTEAVNHHDFFQYFYEKEKQCGTSQGMGSLFSDAEYFEKRRKFGLYDSTTLAAEIKCHTKITQSSIFTIGEILILGKKQCQKESIGFKKWIADNFDFSYETANHYMNVFQYCLGYRELVLNVPLSILYKVAAPSFSEELREYLFLKGNIKNMSNGEFDGLVKKFNDGGMKAIVKDMEVISRKVEIYNQIKHSYDLFLNAKRFLEQSQNNIQQKQQFNDDDSNAKLLNEKYVDCLKDCVEVMDDMLKSEGALTDGSLMNQPSKM